MNQEPSGKTILIDGYNLMWTTATLNPVARFDFNHARDLLILMLRAYQDHSGDEVILVLDGYKGRSPYARRVEREGIGIVITGRGMTADRWIMSAVERPGFDGRVVSSDREIVNFCRSRNVPVTSSGSFEKILMECVEKRRDLSDTLKSRRGHFRGRFKGRRGRPRGRP